MSGRAADAPFGQMGIVRRVYIERRGRGSIFLDHLRGLGAVALAKADCTLLYRDLSYAYRRFRFWHPAG